MKDSIRILKLYYCNKLTVKSRGETIIHAATNQNWIVKEEETTPGSYIGSCLVEPRNFSCPMSVKIQLTKLLKWQLPSH